MNLQKASRLTLFVTLIYVFNSEGSSLPNNDRFHAGACLQSHIEHLMKDVVHRAQTTTQFLGFFCTLNFEAIQDKFNNQNPAPKKNLLTEIKECLQQYDRGDDTIFDTYTVSGISVIDYRKTLRSTPTGLLTTELNNDDNDIDYPVPKDGDEFSLFAYGLCTSAEFVDFSELTETEDKITTVNCCEDCAEDFFIIVNQAFLDEINNLEGTQWDNEEYAKYFNEIVLPDKHRITNFENFKQECQIKGVKTVLDTSIQKINDFGVARLENYDQTYSKIDRMYSPMNNIFMDDKLSEAFFDYKSCIKWSCALNLKNKLNFPFADWLNKKKEAERKRTPIPHSLSRVLLQKPEWRENQSSESGTTSAPAQI